MLLCRKNITPGAVEKLRKMFYGEIGHRDSQSEYLLQQLREFRDPETQSVRYFLDKVWWLLVSGRVDSDLRGKVGRVWLVKAVSLPILYMYYSFLLQEEGGRVEVCRTAFTKAFGVSADKISGVVHALKNGWSRVREGMATSSA